jgi:hypothetical protein
MSLDYRVQGTQINMQTTKALVETMWCGLETKLAEVKGDFVQGLNLTQHEFKMQLKEVEA